MSYISLTQKFQAQFMNKKTQGITGFNFPEGHLISNKYEIISKLGGGYEGEVYMVREKQTKILRAAKFFLPIRNINNKAVNFYAKKLHKLRSCSIVINYLTQDTIIHQGEKVSYLVSDYVEGLSLQKFLETYRNKTLSPFQGLHLLHALAKGLEEIHHLKEYHGDLHSENIIIQRYGLRFDLKVIDMFHWGTAKPINIQDDVVDLVKVFYDALGGKKTYAKQPKEVKEICCGLKRSLILRKFKTAGQLRVYLENMTWD
jgi:serine/threonine protein kinase